MRLIEWWVRCVCGEGHCRASRFADDWKSTHESYLQAQQAALGGGFAEALGRSVTPSDFYQGPAKTRGMVGYHARSPPPLVLNERPMSIFGCPPSARTLLSAYKDSRASVDRFRQRGHGSIVLHDSEDDGTGCHH
jgi:hypothetical protein